MKRAVQRSAGVVLVLVVVGAALAWFGGIALPGPADAGEAQASGGESAELTKGPSRVEVTLVERGDLDTRIEATANLVAEHQISVVAEAPGRIVRLGADEGATVRRGALLVALDPTDATRQRRTAEIRLRAAEALEQRTAELAAKRLVSAEEHEKTVTDRALSKQELADVEATLHRTRIRAPLSGLVTQRSVERGQYVRVGDPLFEITDFDTLVARIYVPERDAMLLDPGRVARLQLQAKPGVKFEGVVRRIASVVDTHSGTVEVTVAVEGAPAHVRSGSFVEIDMIRQHHDDVCLLPRDAVVVDYQGAHVFVVEEGIARRREVEVGDTARGRIHVTGGVEAGETVVLAGQGALQDGAEVEIAPPHEAG